MFEEYIYLKIQKEKCIYSSRKTSEKIIKINVKKKKKTLYYN